MMRQAIAFVAAAILTSGCSDKSTGPRDLTPPAPPRGLTSVTGDGRVFLSWLENTEADVVGYRVYVAPCAEGTSCPYLLSGATTSTSFTVSGLANGTTRFFGVTAFDRSGNESELSVEDIFDTPRPEGSRTLTNYLSTPAQSGYDFSDFVVRAFDDPETDIYFGYNGSVHQMFVPDFATDIQDGGFASDLDAVDFAPDGGWSPSGTVELIVGHCYLVWTRDDHYAKFRVTALSASQVALDWAYQTDPGNRELALRPARDESRGRRPVTWAR